MNPQDLGTGLAGLGIIALTAYNAFQAAVAKREAKAAAGNTEAVRATLTTNNGGSHVKDALDRIESAQADTAQALRDHLATAARTEAHLFERVERLERRRFPFL